MMELSSNRPAVGVASTLRFARRYWLVILVCVAAGALAAYFQAKAQPEQYSATASLVFGEPGGEIAVPGTVQSGDPDRASATDLGLVLRRPIALRALQKLGLRRSPDDLLSHADIEAEGVTNIANLTVVDANPRMAASLANALGEEYIAARVEAITKRLEAAQQEIRDELAEVQPEAEAGSPVAQAQVTQLQAKLNDLNLASSLQSGDAEFVEFAEVPTGPSAPRPMRSAVIGGFLGGLVGLLLALLLYQIKPKLRDASDIEELTDLPVLAQVPRSRELHLDRHPELTSPAMEAFRTLHQDLRFLNYDSLLRTVLITSAEPGEGKSVVSLNLARAAAETGLRVALVEGDLRRPGLAEATGLEPSPGLSDALLPGALGANLQRLEDNRLGGSLDVVVAGTRAPNPAQLIQSVRLHDLLDELRADYDLVVLDTPPLGLVADALALAQKADGVIVVSRVNLSRREPFRRLLDRLQRMEIRTLGVVVNGVAVEKSAYYGYDDPHGGPTAGDADQQPARS
jgi:succinoglycan biosynthesis transport protein ExoP